MSLRLAYARSYALVRFLVDAHLPALARYLDRLREGESDFKASFGPLGDLEEEFDAYLLQVLTG